MPSSAQIWLIGESDELDKVTKEVIIPSAFPNEPENNNYHKLNYYFDPKLTLKNIEERYSIPKYDTLECIYLRSISCLDNFDTTKHMSLVALTKKYKINAHIVETDFNRCNKIYKSIMSGCIKKYHESTIKYIYLVSENYSLKEISFEDMIKSNFTNNQSANLTEILKDIELNYGFTENDLRVRYNNAVKNNKSYIIIGGIPDSVMNPIPDIIIKRFIKST